MADAVDEGQASGELQPHGDVQSADIAKLDDIGIDRRRPVAVVGKAIMPPTVRSATMQEPEFIVVRHIGRNCGNNPMTTQFLSKRPTSGDAEWTSDRQSALTFPTWRKAFNAARQCDGLTAPAGNYPLSPIPA